MSLSATVFIAICITATASQNTLNDFIFGGDYEFLDLTYNFDNKTVYWPGSTSFMFTNQLEEERADGTWYASKDFAAGEHGGTHMDAPYHFWKEGSYVSGIPLKNLIVPLIIVDVSSTTNDNPDFVLKRHHLNNTAVLNNCEKPCLVIFKFGWGKYFTDREKYLGISNDKNTLNFPGLGGDLVEWMVSTYKNMVGIGVDVASVDHGSSSDYPVHKITSSHGLYNLENVNLSENIPEYGCIALVMPMKIKYGTGAPLRIAAICPKQK